MVSVSLLLNLGLIVEPVLLISIERYERGLAIRRRAGQRHQAGSPAPLDRRSLFMTLEGMRVVASEPDWRAASGSLAVGAAIRNASIKGQLRTVRQLASFEDLAFDTCFAIGALFGHEFPNDAKMAACEDEDYAVLVESALRAGLLSDLPERHAIERATDAFVKSIRSTATPQINPYQEVGARLRRFAPVVRIATLSDFRRNLVDIKRAKVHLIGPDLLSAFQVLIDPTVRLTLQQLDHVFPMFKAWNLAGPAYAILAYRSVGAFDDEQQFLRDHAAEAIEALPSDASEHVARLFVGRAKLVPAVADSSYSGRVMNAMERCAFALRAESAPDLHEAIIDLFSLDPSLIEFLPWNRILDVVSVAPGIDVRSLFTTMIMRSPSIQRMSRRIAIGVGDGAFIGDLTLFISAERQPDLLRIFDRIRELPDQAARELTRAVLEPSIFEKLAGAFSGRPAIATMTSDNVHLMRVDAIQRARRRLLVPQLYARTEIDQEVQRAKIREFEATMRSGRVRIPWAEIRLATKSQTDNLPLELLNLEGDKGAGGEMISRAARFIANGVCDAILFDSDDSINQVLSNNLRHGIVIPRVLRAYSDGLHSVFAASRRDLPQWTEAHLTPYFGPAAKTVIELRETANTCLEEFQLRDLWVLRDGNLHTRLRARLESIATQALQSGVDEKFLRQVAEATEVEVRTSLAEAGEALKHSVLPQLLDEVRAVRNAINGEGRNSTRDYLEILETGLDEAIDEVRDWMAIAERDQILPFTLVQLVNLELRTVVLSNWARLKVEVRSIDRRLPADRLTIKGEYFDLFQDVVHNLISNCFKHSGLAARTQVSLSLHVSERALAIRCRNSVAADQMAKIIEQYDSTVERARSNIADGAKLDNLSGFLKIRRAFSRALNRDVEINVSPVSDRRRRFVVEVILVDPPEVWHGGD